jgi:GNAT superfamily N-acetyltransferase
MRIEVAEEPMPDLAEYARVPISFEVRTVLDVTAEEDGGFTLSERAIHPPYVKDYDTHEGPETWARFDLRSWGWFAAHADGRRVGGAAVAFDAPGVDMLEGRRDRAVLWDIRVAPDARGHGAGAALFRAAEAWARARGCRQLQIETQNINVPACRFYAWMGCRLGAIDPAAYPTLPHEVQLLWRKDLPG